ncbi:hypothetical protein FPV67DRAFT_875350 [Lyophyllum atratum]|nr:hypothetical protein FPV67DRAFT_875350 [Lyophyllum atratum]
MAHKRVPAYSTPKKQAISPDARSRGPVKAVRARTTATPLPVHATRDDDDCAQQQRVDQDNDGKDEATRPSRKNIMEEAERRRLLEEDIWTAEVQPKQIRCRGCSRWIKLDARSMYYHGFWEKHRDLCQGIKRILGIPVSKRTRKPNTKSNSAKKAKGTIPARSAAKASRNCKVGDAPVVIAKTDPRPEALPERALAITPPTLHHTMQAHPTATPHFASATAWIGLSTPPSRVGEAPLPTYTTPSDCWDKISRSSCNLVASATGIGKYDPIASERVLGAPITKDRYDNYDTRSSSSRSIDEMDIEDHPVVGGRIVPSNEREDRDPQPAQRTEEFTRIVDHTQPAPATRRMLATDPRIFEPPSTILGNVEAGWREDGPTPRWSKQGIRTRASPYPKPTWAQGPRIELEGRAFPSQRYERPARIANYSPPLSAIPKLRGMRRWESENECTFQQDTPAPDEYRNRVEDAAWPQKVDCEPTARDDTSALNEYRQRIADAPSTQNAQSSPAGPAGPASVAPRHAHSMVWTTSEMHSSKRSALEPPSLEGHSFMGKRSATRDEQESFPIPPSPPWAKVAQTDLADPSLSAQRYGEASGSRGRGHGNTDDGKDSHIYDDAIHIRERSKSTEDGIFAPELPGCPTAPCHHQFRFATRGELKTYFDGATVKSMAKNIPTIDPDVLDGARCLAAFAMNLHRSGSRG